MSAETAVVVRPGERGSGVPELLQKLGAPVRFEEAGADYAVGPFRVERLTGGEFAALVRDGGLPGALGGLEGWGIPVIVVEGDPGLGEGQVAEALAELALRGVSVLRTGGPEETARAIHALYRRVAGGGRRSYLRPSKLRRGGEPAQLAVLTAVPGIGARTARKLLSRFGTLRRVLTAPLGELEEAVGRARARRLAEVLDTIYPPALEEGGQR